MDLLKEEESSVPFLEPNKEAIPTGFILSEKPYKETVKISVNDDQNNNNSMSNAESAEAIGWRRYLGIIYTILAVNMFSLTTSLMKRYSHIHPFNMSFFCSPASIFMSILFLTYAKIRGTPILDSILPFKNHKKDIFFLWFRSVLSSVISYLSIFAFKYVTAADVRTVVSSSVIAVYFFGWMFLGETCGVVPILVAIAAVCGIGIMTKPPMLTGTELDEKTLIGIGLSIACMLVVSMNLTIIRYLFKIHHGVTNLVVYIWGFLQAYVLAMVFGVFDFPTKEEILVLSAAGVVLSLGMAFLVLALQIEEAGVVALIRTSEVLFVFLWQLIVVGTYPDIYSIVGAILVVTGVVVVTLRKWIGGLPNDNANRKRFQFLLK